MTSVCNGLALIVVAGVPLLAGCTGIGPSTVARDRFDYNGEVARSWKEQTLLNIVKARYLDVPVFLEVAQIVSSYALESAASIGGSADLDGGALSGNTITLGAQAKWTDRPTITYTPLTGAQFNRNMMTPIPPSAILHTMEAGWRLDLVFRLAVRSINGVDSQGSDPARYERVITLLRGLQQARAFGLRVQPERRDDTSLVIVFRVRDLTPEQEAMLRELQNILGLEPGRSEFTVVFGVAPTQPGEITLLTRSVLQMLLSLSAYVEVPEADISEGRAAPGTDVATAGLGQLRVRYSPEQPTDALVTIAHRGGWFWIDDRDLPSKATFAIVMLLSTLAETGPREMPPLLTIPAG